MKRLVTLNDWTAEDINEVLSLADTDLTNQLHGKMAANLFFEPSTRTRCSFEIAEHQLGMARFQLDEAGASVQKGESLYDTSRTLESLGVDALVIRHQEKAFYEQLEGISIPVINAGDGAGDHPTQTLLDLFTIVKEFGSIQGVRVCMCGDIRHSRVAHSNKQALERLGAEILTSGPEEWRMPEWDVPHLPMDEAVKEADVLMMLRVQEERHETSWHRGGYLEKHGLTLERARNMQSHAVIMHPAPVNRGVEMADSLVEHSKSRIYTQMKNGVSVRKAVLAVCLQKKGEKRFEAIS
ncbi:aspartate carbamoyltransferase catalytic subunit [Alkalicoccus urumqiensis]|uniref:Aspartate carbamoyltransferase n=1 Tax=Alkalicoccus urumqiensis TaxID=1548213 RepID=A0A2P6MGD8_ALKUR|nr:aspartate carbamoyltransferase catalytic subunit [Alkalicoccus urumqiensis]PRO65300.1 aspartate carbamoyltransferase [Alkalicoccus urumqiensis]